MELNVRFVIETFFLAVKTGIPITLLITAVTLVVSVPLGFFIAVMRKNDKHRVLNLIFSVYISFVRGTPIIVQILIIYNLFPDLLALIVSALRIPFNIHDIPNIFYVCIVFAFSTTAYMSETLRAGLNAVGRGQYEAAMAAGLSTFNAYRRIIAPQAVSAALPVLCTSVTTLVKMTSLSFAMAVSEITGVTRIAASRNLHFVEAFLVIAGVYVVICMAIEFCFKFAERRVSAHKVSI